MTNEIDITISGLGPIGHANIKMRPFTVLAGPNGSGKSFVTKLTYCFFKAISIKHLALKVSHTHKMGVLFLDFIMHNCKENGDYPAPIGVILELDGILKSIDKYSALLAEEISSYSFQIAVARKLSIRIHESIDLLRSLSVELNETHVTDEFNNMDIFTENQRRDKEVLSYIVKEILDLYEILLSPEEGIKKLIENSLSNELLENFQISSTRQLISSGDRNDRHSFINFKGFGVVNFQENAEKTVTLDLVNAGIDQLGLLNPVIFIESPIYWKLRRALSEQGARSSKKNDFGRESLTGVPKHFLDLNEMVDAQVKKDRGSLVDVGEMITTFIKGKLSVTERGEINYHADKHQKNTNGDGVSLTLTASGVINLGIIQLLLEKGIICKGSCLFIDEPEVNLHPGWQKVLMMVLFELSLKGVRIVITTHSIDVMKNIEFLLEKHEDISEAHFGINQLSSEGKSINESDSNIIKVSEIQLDLGKPFHETFIDIGLL